MSVAALLSRCLLAACTLLVGAPAALAKTFVYKQVDGTVWHTNVHPDDIDHSQFELIGIINAPTARARKRSTDRQRFRHCANTDHEFRRRAARFEPMIARLSREYQISKHLVMAVVATESCFNPTAKSSAGALGLMQLMPGTARELGVTDPFDHEQNLRGGISYLGQLSAQFDYNTQLTLAAYNAGPGNVRKYKGIPPFPETQRYVRRVLKQFVHFSQANSGVPLDGGRAGETLLADNRD